MESLVHSDYSRSPKSSVKDASHRPFVIELHKVILRVSEAHKCRIPTPFDEDMHATSQTGDKIQGGLLLYVLVCKGAIVLQLLSSKDQTLLVRANAFLVMDLGLNIINSV